MQYNKQDEIKKGKKQKHKERKYVVEDRNE